jgi:hypothetical protein
MFEDFIVAAQSNALLNPKQIMLDKKVERVTAK